MKKIFILATIFLSIQAPGQNFKQEFSKLCGQKDTTGQLKLLEKWQKADPNDAELYVAWFNYYFSKSKTELVSLTTDRKPGAALEIRDTANTKTVGYLSSDFSYNNDLLKKGFQYIDSGISKFPARLDMRFGKVYVFGQIENYEEFTNEIVKTIDFAATINNQWTWTDNKKLDDPKKFLLSTIQEYVLQLYDAGDNQLDRMRKIAQTVLKYYPDHVESLSNLAITYSLQGDDDHALEALLKAEKLAPKDYIVLNNIANVYNNKGDKPNAIKYYELTLKYGDEEAKAQATKKLKTLRK